MPASIKGSEIAWKDSISIKFAFSVLEHEHGLPIMRQIMRGRWPAIRRPKQCVYVIRLNGEVAVDYPRKFSPVVYVGRGNASSRLYGHANWLVSLVRSVPQLSIEVHVAEVARKNHSTLYHYIEADLLRWFADEHGSLPWFNRRREREKEGQYDYEPEAEKELRRHLGVGSGSNFQWAIRPTHNNEQHEPYLKGRESEM